MTSEVLYREIGLAGYCHVAIDDARKRSMSFLNDHHAAKSNLYREMRMLTQKVVEPTLLLSFQYDGLRLTTLVGQVLLNSIDDSKKVVLQTAWN